MIITIMLVIVTLVIGNNFDCCRNGDVAGTGGGAYILNLLPKGIASYTNTFTPIFSTYSQRGLHHIQNVHSYILNLLPKGIASYTNTFTP